MVLFTGFAQLDLEDKTTYLKVTQLNFNIFFSSIRSSYWFSSAYNFFRCSFRFYLISCFSTDFLFSRILIERRLQLLHFDSVEVKLSSHPVQGNPNPESSSVESGTQLKNREFH